MKKSAALRLLAIFLLAILFGGGLSARRGESAITITINNNRPHALFMAFRWSGFDLPYDRRSGWYNVKAQSSRTITFKNAVYPLTAEDFGYYAKGGGLVWSGKEDVENPMAVIINPKKAFGGHPEDPVEGGEKVYFRPVKLRRIQGSDTDGEGALTFNP